MNSTPPSRPKTIAQHWNDWRNEHPVYSEMVPGLRRLGLAILGPIVAALIGITLFEPQNPWELANMYHQNLPWTLLPTWIIFFMVPFTSIEYFRYLLPPLGAIVFIFIAAANYDQDIYDFKQFKPAMDYVIASVFGISYPRVRIEAGKVQEDVDEENPLTVIGGPGWALIQPGNSVFFRHLREPSRASITRPYFMRPFETVSQVTSLDDQHGHVERVETVTQDGLKVEVRDIHFRFRVQPEEKDGKHVYRSPEHPYPFDEKALRSMSQNLSVAEEGLDQWQKAVQRVIVGSITGYINNRNLDFLTAPREKGQDPRVELRTEAFTPEIRRGLARLGAELIWIDVGHIDIVAEDVEQERLAYWSSGMIGNANVIRAYGDAKRLKYQELGRAQCQAELIMSISDALQDVSLGADPAQNSQKILMARTAEILDAISRRDQDSRGKE
jgi:hypothetical protein